MKTVALIGGAGFLGAHIASVLATESNLIVVVRNGSDTSRLKQLAGKVTLLQIAENQIESAVKDLSPDSIIYCAVNYGSDPEDSELIETNVRLPMSLARSLRAKNGQFVHFDTFYSKFSNYQHLIGYQSSKRQCLEELSTLSQDVRVVNARLEQVYGPGDSLKKSLAALMTKICRESGNIQLTLGEQRRDFIFVDDVARAVSLFIRDSNQTNCGISTVEIGTGVSHSLKEFLLMVKDTAQSQVQLEFGALPYREGEPMESVADPSELSRRGWHPGVSLLEGVRRTVESIQVGL